MQDHARTRPPSAPATRLVDWYGLGPIQRRIRRAFVTNPDRQFHTVELVALCYPRLTGKPARKHRWAICRAAKRVAHRVGRDSQGVIFRRVAV